MNQLEDLREWLVSKIDGAIESYGEDSLISSFINQIDAQDAQLAWARKERCKHGVWLSDQCYSCAKEQLSGIAEPRGCPTPGACSCPGTIPDAERKKVMTAHMLAESIVERATVETPRTDAVVRMLEAGWLSLGSSAPGAVKPLIETLEAFERELIDIKGRLLPQYLGRAERAEKNRDALLEQLIVAEKRVADQMTAGVSTWADAWRESK